MYADQSIDHRPTVSPFRPIRLGLVAVLSGADGLVRQALAIVCAATATVSAGAIVDIVTTSYLA